MSIRSCLTILGAVCLGTAIASSAKAEPQSAEGLRPSAGTTVIVEGITIQGPPPPEAPAMIARDSQGRATIRAVHVPKGIQIDGRLDEQIYLTVPPMTDFVQMEPNPGAPATEKTDLWIAYDADNVYVLVRCWDSQPEGRWIANDMRRDSSTIPRNENVAFIFDTYYDRRNAVVFEITPIGGIWDGTAANDRTNGSDWNPVWAHKTGRFPGGWTAEMAIPFKSLRYTPGVTQVWGFNLRRTIRWKNEETFLKGMPLVAGASGAGAIMQVSNAATLVGIEAPSGSKNLEIKPYALSSLTSDRVARPPFSNDLHGDVGVDVKYGVAQNLTADFTYNTDFAQVEVDAQQVNLTRFSLFFPEKREFFLEGQGIFDFGGAASGGRITNATIPLLFFSRVIGLSGSRTVPIDAGGRLSGRVGRYTVGVLNVQAHEEPISGTPSTNFLAARVKRDIFGHSSVGLLATRRSKSTVGPGSADTFGADATLRLHDFVVVNAYLAKTSTPGLVGDDLSHRVQFNYNGDRYGVELERLAVGDNFLPDVGFLQRDDFRRSYAVARFSPRPKSMKAVRKFTYQGVYDYYADGRGRMETRDVSGQFMADLQNSDTIHARYDRRYEFLKRPFSIAPGVAIPIGGYSFQDAQLAVGFGNQRRLSGTVSVDWGSFYSGDRTTLEYTAGRLLFGPRFSVEPGASINWVDLREGSFTSTILSNRAIFTPTPLMFFTALVQYNSNSNAVGSNLRLRWEYRPGSELFVVYTDEFDTLRPGFPDLRNRAFVVKINRLFRF